MSLNLTREQIDILWNQGYRCFEIYVFNDRHAIYNGEFCEAGTIPGWDIKFVVSTREAIKEFPFFDCIIGIAPMSDAQIIWPENR
jgi:hypothetical protein